MKERMDKRLRTRLVAGLIVGSCVAAALAQPADKPAAPVVVQKALDDFRASGKDASVTVVGTNLAGKPVKQVAEVVGMFLERAGMKNVEIGESEFRLPEKADLAQTAQVLAEFLRTNPPKTDYVLFADFLATRETGFTEVRGVIVNKQGQLVWQDRQTAEDADFKRVAPKEPMDCIQLLVERLRPVLKLDDPTRGDAPEGKIIKRWQQKTGVPDEAKQAAMKERQAAFKKSAATATLLIYPAHAGDEWSPASATHLVQMINEAKLIKAMAAEKGPQLDVKGDMNEQKVLWGMARAFREQVQKQPLDADYVLYPDYLMGGNVVGGVHFAICDRKGELVIVDFQNSHWPDFQSINPKSREDCDRLVVKRLEGYCK